MTHGKAKLSVPTFRKHTFLGQTCELVHIAQNGRVGLNNVKPNGKKKSIWFDPSD